MIAISAIKVTCIPQEDGGFFLHGRDVNTSSAVHPMRLKWTLFAWHEPSFYGALIETEQLEAMEGIRLAPSMALDYIASPKPLALADIVWDEAFILLQRSARLLREALANGWYAPSFEKHKSGRFGWKLVMPDDRMLQLEQLQALLTERGLTAPELWLDTLIASMMREDADIAAAWNAISTKYAALLLSTPSPVTGERGTSGVAPRSGKSKRSDERIVPTIEDDIEEGYFDEDDWLTAIGWKSDDTPFSMSLQLSEPLTDQHWQLRFAMQDRERPERLIAWAADEFPEPGVIPAEWEPYVPGAMLRMTNKVLKAAPELAKSGPFLSAGAALGGLTALPDAAAAGVSAAHVELAAAGETDVSNASGALDARIRPFLTDEEAWEFMDRHSGRIAKTGCAVLLPSWWQDIGKLKPRLRAIIRSSVGSQANSLFGLQQIVQYDWRVAIGDLQLTDEEFRMAAAHRNKLVRVRGRWVHFDPALLEHIRRAIKRYERKGLTLRDVLEMHLLGEAAEVMEDGTATAAGKTEDAEAVSATTEHPGSGLRLEVELNVHLAQFMNQLLQTGEAPDFAIPPGMLGELRGYQRKGASWMAFLRRFGLGACLADDMGLGKTIQFITYLLYVKQTEQTDTPALLIAPTSVLGNWQKELERFAPSLDVRLHYGAARPKQAAFTASVTGADLIITSYALSHLDETELASIRWHAVCLDEAQNIKNAYTKQSAAIRRLPAGHRIALTGTPIENRLTEFWSIFDFINPGYLGSLSDFTRRFVSDIERTNDAALIGQVQRMARPFLMRRLKKDPQIMLDLPEKNESKTYVSLTIDQGTLYENVVQELMENIEKLTAMERRGLILATLTKLKQICNHPALYTKEQLPDSAGASVERSNKLARLLEMVQEMRSEGEKGLIFTQYVEMGHMLQSVLSRELDEPVLFLHGGISKTARDRMIDRFQFQRESGGERCGVFILSLKAGGTGLNLTAANHVFHYDRWWNPAVENQATDRSHRIGQTKDVHVHKFVTLGTLEERIDDMIERKMSLSNQIVGSGENWITELSAQDLRELLMLRKEWINR